MPPKSRGVERSLGCCRGMEGGGSGGRTGTHLVDGPVVLVVLPPEHLDPVHEDELPREQAAHVDVLERLGQVLGQARLVPEQLRVHDLLDQDAGAAEHGPARVDQLGLLVPGLLGGLGREGGWRLVLR